MNKEVKFSRFVGVAIVIICIWIVVLALMSALLKNENNENMIYIDGGSSVVLSIPKSNIISNHIDMEKEITTENGIVEFKVRIPKINIETEVVNSINDKIYSIYQESYSQILKTNSIQKIDMDYTYEYLDNDSIIEITVVTKTNVDNKIDKVENKFTYDLKNDKAVIK